ncbi:MAG TPA: undecaprenyl-diphosphate phosphatase [Solirubrobacteraceae bacterium]|nr:undecaprenyl-diphosphate phosphatase [Solirubrobacteraceae bacterium]
MRRAERALSLRRAVALGLLQGPAELLPISSSGHTTLIPWLAGWSYAELDGELRKSFEVALHAGAGLALAIDMRAELLRQARSLDGRRTAVLALALAPPAIAGYALREPIERRLGGPRSIAAGLIAGAVAMALADARADGPGDGARECEDARALDGLALGLAQATALIPGVSRNGAALTAARARGFGRGAAETLSWNAALPVILGASVLKATRLARRGAPPGAAAPLAAGGGTAFLSTLVSARILRHGGREDRGGRALLPYSIYRCLLAALVIRRLRRAQ